MLKLIYRRIPISENTKDFRVTEIAQSIGPVFGLTPDQAAKCIADRNTLGATEIADDFDLPHLEVEGRLQGLALFEFIEHDEPIYHSLVLVVNSLQPAAELKPLLANLLQVEMLQVLRDCHTEQTFTKIIKEMEDV